MFISQRGFNLLEMLVAVSIAVVMLTMGVPAAKNTLERRTLSAAAEEVLSFTQLARTESIKRNRNIFVSFKMTAGNQWCAGLSQTSACDCNAAGACQLDGIDRVVSSNAYRGVTLSQTFTDGTTGFDARRGLAIDTGIATLSTQDLEIQIQVSTLGQVRLCSPSGGTDFAGLGTC